MKTPQQIRIDRGSILPPPYRGGVVALGNFDGFHLGHQAVIAAAVAQAKALGAPALVATFDPHPIRCFRPDAPPFRLTSLEQRARLFAAAGVDATLVLTFDRALADLSAEAFMRECLADQLAVRAVVTGEDFTFGKGRGGSVETLAREGPAHGFVARAVGAVCDPSGVISSTRVRDALIQGDCSEATRLLTRPFTISGTVVAGDRRGRTLGFPTANMDLGDWQRPAYGIYAARVRLADGRLLSGAANLGIRPSFDPPREGLETYIFDFAEDLYGQTLEVALHARIRGEAKFDTIEALIARMHIDCAEARRLLGAPATVDSIA